MVTKIKRWLRAIKLLLLALSVSACLTAFIYLCMLLLGEKVFAIVVSVIMLVFLLFISYIAAGDE